MRLTVLYFARLRESVGRGSETVEVPAGVRSAGELRAWLIGRGAPWAEAFAEVQPVRCALDQALVADDAPLHDGAEVAFFPPVTGG
jgi:molybdopterin synthase sulfur carrier subunit